MMKLPGAHNRIFRFCLYICSAIAFLFLIEGLYFYRIIQSEKRVTQADAIAVFGGSGERVEAGCKLADSGYAPYLIISSAGAKQLGAYRLKYNLPQSVRFIKEEKARTTFENAYYAGKLIRHNNFKSIILISSCYHLPRSFFLLKTVLLGQGVRVQIYCPQNDKGSFWDVPGRSKLLRFEMLRFWGSLSEFIYCKISGGVPAANPKENPIIKRLKRIFFI